MVSPAVHRSEVSAPILTCIPLGRTIAFLTPQG